MDKEKKQFSITATTIIEAESREKADKMLQDARSGETEKDIGDDLLNNAEIEEI